MANIVHMIILLVCVYLADSKDTRRSSVKHMMMNKRSISDDDDGFKAYVDCNDYFTRLYEDNILTYHGVCHARDKLNLCKERVLKWHPSLEKHITGGYQVEYEVIADFWCTYNTTHHGPAEPYLTMDDMYRKYFECPYVHDWMFTHEDYSPQINLAIYRAAFASIVLRYTGVDGLSKWQGMNYSNPHDPVHKALSAWCCDGKKAEAYHTDNIMSRYCVIVKDIDNELNDVQDTINRHTVGLYNWSMSLCSEYEDTLEQVMRISQLDKWLSHQKKPDLSPCHDHNIYIEGATCLIMFHTRLPPYSDLLNVMPPFVKNIAELNFCWEQVISGCPQGNSVHNNISLIIEIYNLASDISKEDSAQVWDVIWSWSELYKKTEQAQSILQIFYQMLSHDASSHVSHSLSFGSSLEAALSRHKSPLSHNITDLFSKLSSVLKKLSVVVNDDYSGVNIFEGFRSMNSDVHSLLFILLQPLYVLFVEVGEFVQYTGRCPEWWPLPCE